MLLLLLLLFQIYTLNGLLLLVAFTHRVVISAYFTYWIWSVQDQILRVSSFWFSFLFIGSIVLGGMNAYWYCELVKRVVYHFVPSLAKDKAKMY